MKGGVWSGIGSFRAMKPEGLRREDYELASRALIYDSEDQQSGGNRPASENLRDMSIAHVISDLAGAVDIHGGYVERGNIGIARA